MRRNGADQHKFCRAEFTFVQHSRSYGQWAYQGQMEGEVDGSASAGTLLLY